MSYKFIPYTPADIPLHEMTICLVTTAGVHMTCQPPFHDERATPDISYRTIPGHISRNRLTVTNAAPFHQYNTNAPQKDINTVFPIDRLRELASENEIGAVRRSCHTMAWGLAVAIAVYAVGSVSGAHINPAVTIGLASIGEFPWADVPTYILAQMIGAFIGAVLVWLHYLPHWGATQDKDLKLAVFSTGPAIRDTKSNLLSEIIGTFVLVLGILAIGANEFTQGLNPLIIGFLIVAIGLSLGGTTGYAINPARDLGPRIAHAVLPIAGKGKSDWQYAWIPVVGPIIGGVLGALFYVTFFGA